MYISGLRKHLEVYFVQNVSIQLTRCKIWLAPRLAIGIPN